MATPQVFSFDRESPAPDLVDQLAEHILTGGVVVLPTDTVYGLIGDAIAQPAAEEIFHLKNRSPQAALPIFVDEASSLSRWCIRLSPKFMTLAEEYWPGPLTLVLPVWPGFYLRVGGDGRSVGVRATAEPIVLALMRKTNRFLLATSANPSGVNPGAVDLRAWLTEKSTSRVLWCRPESYESRSASTVIDLTGRAPVLLRQGTIPQELLKKFLPDLQLIK